jgi:hypothetical protein
LNLGEIKRRILKRLDDDQLAPAAYSPNEITAAVNEGLQLFCFLTLCLEGTGTVPVDATLAPLTYISDYIVPLRVEIAGVKIRSARLAQLDALDAAWRSSVAAPTRYWVKGWNLMGFNGAALASATVTYAKWATALESDGDTPAIPELYHPALVDYGTGRVLAPQGGQMLVRASNHIGAFLGDAKRAAALMRTRSKSLQYDTEPPELDRIDLSRLIQPPKGNAK